MLTFAKTRRSLLLVVAGAVIAAGGVAPTTTASAADGCYVQLQAQNKIAITGPYRDVIVKLYDKCGIANFVAIDEYGPAGYDTGFIFDGNTTDHWDIYDDQTTGTFNTRSALAFDDDYNDIAFRSTRTVVKFGSRAAIATKRSANKVTISVNSTSYFADSEKFTGWNGSSPTIQYKSGSTWKYLKRLTLKGGKASYTYTSSATRDYRFVNLDSSNRFGATSPTSRR